jgi:hypothetical protein
MLHELAGLDRHFGWKWARSVRGGAACLALVVGLAGCGGGSGAPQSPAAPPAPTPTPSPTPAGTIRLVSSSLPSGSNVKVSPMFVTGQQAPDLSFTVAVTLRESLSSGLVRAWVRTDAQRCMGGGQAHLEFQAGVELGVEPGSMSATGSGTPLCTLPFTTTLLEIEVIGADANHPLVVQSFPAVYHFTE